MQISDREQGGSDVPDKGAHDLYSLYVQFETQRLEYVLRIVPVEWVRAYRRRVFRLLTCREFASRWRSQSEEERVADRGRWEIGFEAWNRRERVKDEEDCRRLGKDERREIDCLLREGFRLYRSDRGAT